MRVVLLSTTEQHGGAARATWRLHRALLRQGTESTLVVHEKTSNASDVVLSRARGGQTGRAMRPALDRLPVKLYGDRETDFFSPQWIPERIPRLVQGLDPSVVNVHWTQNGFVRIETFARFDRPVVLTMHDMWAITGGCHYSGDCRRFEQSCGSCPMLGSQKKRDLSRWGYRRKGKTYSRIDLTVVTPSRWLAEEVGKSSLLHDTRVEVIPNGIDLSRFRPVDRQQARKLLGLPANDLLILTVALPVTPSQRKGFDLLASAISSIEPKHPPIRLVVAGSSEGKERLGRISIQHLGRLTDDLSLSLAYSAADVFVAPSRQDNLPNTLLEAMACGTPSVGFEVGGIPDVINHKVNGYLAGDQNAANLKAGILWVLADSKRWTQLSQEARATAETKYDDQLQARRYLALYEDLADALSA